MNVISKQLIQGCSCVNIFVKSTVTKHIAIGRTDVYLHFQTLASGA